MTATRLLLALSVYLVAFAPSAANARSAFGCPLTAHQVTVAAQETMVVAPAKARSECDFVSADPGVRVADQAEHTLQVGAALLTGRLAHWRTSFLNGSLPPSALGYQRLFKPHLPHGAIVLYRNTATNRQVDVYLRDRSGREWAVTLESQSKRRPTLGAMLNAGVRLLRANAW